MKLNWRSFVTLTMALLGLSVAISGIALFFAPPGSLVNAKLLGISKEAWELFHTTVSLVIVAMGILHVWFNRRALIMYFKRAKLELAAATIVTLVLVGSSLAYLPPATWIDQVRLNIETWWREHYQGAKGFGQMTLAEVCQQYGVPLNKAINYLKQKYGIEAKPNELLMDIAAKVGTSPAVIGGEIIALKTQSVQQVMQKNATKTMQTTMVKVQTATTTQAVAQRQATGQAAQSAAGPMGTGPQGGGMGYGMETLQQFCQQNGIPLQEAINYLQQKYGISVTPDMTIRDIAFSVGLKPYQLITELQALGK